MHPGYSFNWLNEPTCMGTKLIKVAMPLNLENCSFLNSDNFNATDLRF